MCEQTDLAVKNTDRELWREDVTDRPGDRVFVTEGGGIGMSHRGYTAVLTVPMWMACMRECFPKPELAGEGK
jgi:hypothetical protein